MPIKINNLGKVQQTLNTANWPGCCMVPLLILGPSVLKETEYIEGEGRTGNFCPLGKKLLLYAA